MAIGTFYFIILVIKNVKVFLLSLSLQTNLKTMLGILFIYWIWKSFTNLAIEYNKNKWTYFFIGIVGYYGSTIIAGFITGLVSVLINGIDTNEEDFINPGWNILFVLCGGLGCYGMYKLLEYRGEKEKARTEKDSIENIGLTEEV